MKALYWTSTTLIVAMLVASALAYLLHSGTIDGVRALGFPDHFRIQLAILKLIAAVVLLLPVVPIQLKEWAYVGTALFLLTAIVAHTAHGDPFLLTIINLALAGLLVASNMSLTRLHE